MLISARQAATLLALVGVTRRQARQLLDAGLAGPAVETSTARLYEAARVGKLVDRPILSDHEVDRLCPRGLFVARGAGPSTWRMSAVTSAWIRWRVQEDGYLPYLTTLAGYVTGGGDIVGVTVCPSRPGASRTCGVDLRSPGPWFGSFEGRRYLTPPGMPWLLRGAPL